MSSSVSSQIVSVLQVLDNKPVERTGYRKFFNALQSNLFDTFTSYVPGWESIGTPYEGRDPDKFLVVLNISRQLAPHRVTGGADEPGPADVHLRTWADYANFFWQAVVSNNLVAYANDDYEFLKILRFVEYLSSTIDALMSAMHEGRQVAHEFVVLAHNFVNFLVTFEPLVGDGTPAEVADGTPVNVVQGIPVLSIAHGTPAEVVEVADGTPVHVVQGIPVLSTADGTPAEVVEVAEGTPVHVVQGMPAVEEVEVNAQEPVAEQPQEPVAEQPQEPVAEQPQPVAEQPQVDEDGDVVMEAVVVSERRGSKRLGYAMAYEDEVKRAKRAKEDHGLRDTAARRERLRKLKKADDAKRKGDGEAEGSSKASRKRSRK